MRRLFVGCIIDVYVLYVIFMFWFSQCIYMWDFEDVEVLVVVKKFELEVMYVENQMDDDVFCYIKISELVMYCRRIIRGVEEIIRFIFQLIQFLDGDKG